jgi:hypothetical protein
MFRWLLAQALLVATTVTAAAPATETTAPAASPAAVVEDRLAFEADFSTAPDGYPTHPRMVFYGSSDEGPGFGDPTPSGGLQVVDGALQSLGTSGLASGYAQTDLGAPVTRIGAEFSFPDGGSYGGAIALPVWTEPFQLTYPRIPTAPVHFVLTRDDWAYQGQWDDTTVTVATGTFARRLPADTPLRVELTFDGPDATLHLPDGTTTTVSDPRIAIPASYATFESFRLEAATMVGPRIVRIWADT